MSALIPASLGGNFLPDSSAVEREQDRLGTVRSLARAALEQTHRFQPIVWRLAVSEKICERLFRSPHGN